MSREGVEIVRRIYAAFNRGDRVALESMLTSRFRLFDPPELPGGGEHSGADAVQWLFEQFRGTFDELRLEPEEFIESGDDLVVVFRASGRSREGRVPLDERFAHLFRFEGAKVAEVRAYLDRATALEAAGLRE